MQLNKSLPESTGFEGFSFLVSPQQEDCEKAYFKMDNVLIDDRRIHVDFSQSVAKIRWKGKGRRQRPRLQACQTSLSVLVSLGRVF